MKSHVHPLADVVQRVRRGKLIALSILLQLGLPGAIAAQRAGIERLFPAEPAGYVTDAAGVIDPARTRDIERRIADLRSATGAEIAVVTLPTIGDYAPVDVAVAIGRAWGVGAKAAVGDPTRNAGVVVLLVPRRDNDPNSGHIFIATGRGIEGIVPDAVAGRIRDRMVPALRQGDYGAGLLTGVEALSERITAGLSGARPTEEARRATWRRLLPLLIILVVIVVLVLVVASTQGGRRGSRRPPPRRSRRRPRPRIYWGGGWGRGGGFGGGGFGGGFGGFGGGGGFSGGGAGGRF